jgi:2-hydroxychromene-2-carboxylate isomerase
VTGEGLRDTATVRACWARAGLEPGAYDAELAAARAPLQAATEAAIAEGVPGVPTVTVGGRHFWGDDALEDAAAALSR